MSMGMTSAPPVLAKDAPAWRLPALMMAAGAIAGGLIVTAYRLTLPRIEQHKGELMRAAVQEVLKAPHSFDTLYLDGGRLLRTLPAGMSPRGLERVYLGHDSAGKRIGFAISATGSGFQEPVTVVFGYDATARRLIAMRVISNKETPGLGDKIGKDSAFMHGFVNAATPLTGVKADRGKQAPSDVIMITGATISSRAVIRIVNTAIARWQALLDAYREEARP